MGNFIKALVTRRALAAVVRHGMTAIGGYLVASGMVEADTLNGTEWEAVQGGVVAAVGLVWSIADKAID